MSSGTQSSGVALASQVSGVLRAADLPVLRYAESVNRKGFSGIRVRGYGSGQCYVSINFYMDDHSLEAEKDPAAEREWSDKAYGLLRAKGFDARRSDGDTNFLVYARDASAPGELEDVQAVAAAFEAATGHEISNPIATEWLITVGTDRMAYAIKRTGKAGKYRYLVERRFDEVGRGLATLAAALDAVTRDIEKAQS